MPSPTPLAAVLVLAVAISGPAWSETIGEYGPVTLTVRVPVGDLDLAQPSGADELLRRVRAAARRACGGEPDVSPLLLQERRMYRACTDQAVGQAVAGLESPMVNERYAQLAGPVTLQLPRARP